MDEEVMSIVGRYNTLKDPEVELTSEVVRAAMLVADELSAPHEFVDPDRELEAAPRLLKAVAALRAHRRRVRAALHAAAPQPRTGEGRTRK